eukprot:m.248788 g.248788  ORF g.248788 m.248788 type:complete len:1410 (-) comp16136_c0_seq22:85-4314(-)
MMGDTDPGAESPKQTEPPRDILDDTDASFQEAARWARKLKEAATVPDIYGGDEDLDQLFNNDVPLETTIDNKKGQNDQEAECLSKDTNQETPAHVNNAIVAARLQEADDAVEEKRAQNLKLQSINAKLTHENKEAMDKSEKYKTEMENFKLKYREEQQKSNDANLRARKAEETAEFLKTRGTEREEEIQKLVTELEALKAKYSDELFTHQEQQKEVMHEFERECREKAHVEMETTRQQLSSEWSTKLEAAVAKEKSKWKRKYETLQKDYKAIEPRYQAIRSELEVKSAALELDLNFAKSEQQTITAELEAAKANIKTLKKSLKKSRAECTTLSKKLDGAKFDNNRLTVSIEGLKNELAGLKNDVTHLESQRDSLNEQTNLLRGNLDDAKFEVQSAIDKRQEHERSVIFKEKEVSTLKERLDDAVQEIASRDARINRLQAEARQAQQKIELGQEALKRTESKLESTRQRKRYFENELKYTKSESAGFVATATSNIIELANIEKQLLQLCSTLSESNTKLTTMGIIVPKPRLVVIERVVGQVLTQNLGVTLKQRANSIGLRVTNIRRDSPAAKAENGLCLGDVIVKVGDLQVMNSTVDKVQSYLNGVGERLVLEVVSGDEVDSAISYFKERNQAAVPVDDNTLEDIKMNHNTQASKDVEVDTETKDAGFDLLQTVARSSKQRTELASSQIKNLESTTSAIVAALEVVGNRIDEIAAHKSSAQHKSSILFQQKQNMELEMEELEKQLRECREQLDEKRIEVAKSKEDFEALSTNIGVLGNRLAEAQTDKVSLDVELQKTSATLTTVAEERAKYESEAKELKFSLDTTKTELAEMTEKAHVAQESNVKLEKSLSECTKSLEEYKAKSESLTKSIEVATTGEYAMGQELITVSARADEATERLEIVERELKERQQEVIALQKELQDNRFVGRDTGTSSKSDQNDLRTLRSDLEKERSEKADLEAGLREALASLAEAESKVGADNKGDSETLQTERLQHEQTKHALDTTKNDLETAKKEIAGLKANRLQFKELQAQIKRLKDAESQKSETSPDTKDDTSKDEIITDLEGKLSHVTQEAEGYKNSLEQLEQSYALDKVALETAKSDLQEAQSDNQVLASRIKDLMKSGRTKSAEGPQDQHLVTECEKLEQMLAVSKNNNEKLQMFLAEAKSQLMECETKKQGMELLINLQADGRQSLEERLSVLSKELETLRGGGEGTPGDEVDDLRRRANDAEQLLQLGTFERQTLQESLVSANKKIEALQDTNHKTAEIRVKYLAKLFSLLEFETRVVVLRKQNKREGWGLDLSDHKQTDENDAEHQFVEISGVRSDSVASSCGLKEGDLIIAVNGNVLCVCSISRCTAYSFIFCCLLSRYSAGYQAAANEVRNSGNLMYLNVAHPSAIYEDEDEEEPPKDNPT